MLTTANAASSMSITVGSAKPRSSCTSLRAPTIALGRGIGTSPLDRLNRWSLERDGPGVEGSLVRCQARLPVALAPDPTGGAPARGGRGAGEVRGADAVALDAEGVAGDRCDGDLVLVVGDTRHR